MEVSLVANDVSDLCLGKPPLRSLSLSASVGDALFALKSSDANFISVWNCHHSSPSSSPVEKNNSFIEENQCRCVAKICMADVICYLSKEENLFSPSAALQAPLSVLLPENCSLVIRHVEPSCSLLEAIDLILEGAQNLVVPITGISTRKLQGEPSATHHSFCWLTQEDIIRFLLTSNHLFSPIAFLSINQLSIITTQTFSINYHSPASSALGFISRSLASQTSVAVLNDTILIGEISPFTLACCDETVAAAIATLSAGDLIAYIDSGGPPADLVRLVEQRLKDKNLSSVLEEFVGSVEADAFSSSDDGEEFLLCSPTTTLRRLGKHGRSYSYSARTVRRAEAIVCHPKSSLMAVMIQAISHRSNYVWVVENDGSLVGLVTFYDMLKIFRENIECMV